MSPSISIVPFIEPNQSAGFGSDGSGTSLFSFVGFRVCFFIFIRFTEPFIAESSRYLESLPDLPQDRLSFRRWVCGFGDRATNHDVTGSRLNRLCRCEYSGLVCVAGAGGPHAGGDDSEIVSQFLT